MSSDPQPTTLPPKVPSSRWSNRILVVMLGAVAMPVGMSILYTHAPTEYTFLPCMFYQITGLHCPGCGATRSLYALMHLDLEQALAYNPLFVILLPFLVFAALGVAYSLWTGKRAPGSRMAPWSGKLILGVLIVYWIARNIDMYPFHLLAPHPI